MAMQERWNVPQVRRLPRTPSLVLARSMLTRARAQVSDPAGPAVISIKVTTETEDDGSVTVGDGKDLSPVEKESA